MTFEKFDIKKFKPNERYFLGWIALAVIAIFLAQTLTTKILIGLSHVFVIAAIVTSKYDVR